MARAHWHDGADRSLNWLAGMAAACGAWQNCMYQQRTSRGVDQIDVVVEYKSHEQRLCSGQSWGNQKSLGKLPFPLRQ